MGKKRICGECRFFNKGCEHKNHFTGRKVKDDLACGKFKVSKK